MKHLEELSPMDFNAIFASVKDQKPALSLGTRSALLVAGTDNQGILLDTAAQGLVVVTGEGPSLCVSSSC